MTFTTIIGVLFLALFTITLFMGEHELSTGCGIMMLAMMIKILDDRNHPEKS